MSSIVDNYGKLSLDDFKILNREAISIYLYI